MAEEIINARIARLAEMNDRLIAENARLRAALRTIAGSGFISEALADIARKALGNG